jgi:hypothetical protein
MENLWGGAPEEGSNQMHRSSEYPGVRLHDEDDDPIKVAECPSLRNSVLQESCSGHPQQLTWASFYNSDVSPPDHLTDNVNGACSNNLSLALAHCSHLWLLFYLFIHPMSWGNGRETWVDPTLREKTCYRPALRLAAPLLDYLHSWTSIFIFYTF